MATEKLTARQVAAAKPGAHGDGKGLWLKVGASGSKSWCFRYMRAGRAREMGLGSAADVSLAEAREAARACRRMLMAGVDPLDAKRKERIDAVLAAAKEKTFGECAESYIAAHESEWTNAKHRQQWVTSFFGDRPHVPAAIIKLPVAAIDDAIALKILEPLWAATPATASRVRGRCESVIDWAIAAKFRTAPNPFRWKGHLEHLLAAPAKRNGKKHLAALPYTEVGTFMAELRRQTTVAARALALTILCAVRTGETLGATRSEIDEQNRLWIIPAARTKTGRAHEVPLSDAAMTVLAEMRRHRQGERIFPGLGRDGMARALKVLRPDVTVHGFRSCFRDWAGDMTHFPREICEAALGHAVGSEVEQSYRRGSALAKRRQLMAQWARYCCAAPAGTADVIPLAGSAGRDK